MRPPTLDETSSGRWLKPDEAAAWLGVSIPNVRVIAHREKWRRSYTGRGPTVLYDLEAVRATVVARNDKDIP